MWIKNTAGTPDSMLTFALGGFIITSVVVIISFLGKLSVGNFSLEFVTLDASHVSLVSMFLGATLLGYINRRNKKDDIKAKKEDLLLRHKLGYPLSEEEEKNE